MFFPGQYHYMQLIVQFEQGVSTSIHQFFHSNVCSIMLCMRDSTHICIHICMAAWCHPVSPLILKQSYLYTLRKLRVHYSLDLLPCYACCGRSHCLSQCLTVSNSVSGYATVRWHLVLCYHVFRSTQTPRACQRSIRGRAHTVVNLADALGR